MILFPKIGIISCFVVLIVMMLMLFVVRSFVPSFVAGVRVVSDVRACVSS